MSSHKSDQSREDADAHGAVPQVGVIYNPRSHRNKGQDLASDPAPHVYVSQPGERSQLPAALRRFADRGIDLLVINGGDGTVRDVLTAGCEVFGENWPTVAVLPKGKTNARFMALSWGPACSPCRSAQAKGRTGWAHSMRWPWVSPRFGLSCKSF